MTKNPAIAGRPLLVHQVDAGRAAILAAQKQGKTTGLIPTMGALHEGHLSLVQAAQAECGYTAVTIFVNPSQFGPHEDLQKYPRTLESDLAALARQGVDLVFVPSVEEIYPPGFSTAVDPPAVAELWEGERRPGHFRGVTTVVLKLFQILPADIAYFGQKDYQQSLVIRRMVQDLNLPIEIRVCPIVREADGLAMSSRNRYLNADERKRALSIKQSLDCAAELIAQGQSDAAAICKEMRNILARGGIDDIDYVALANPETLAPVDDARQPLVALVAARVGATRLIDNQRISSFGS